MSALKIVENPDRPLAMHPQKFGLYVFMVSVVMVFASLTSAYIVKRGDGNWRVFELPDLFWYTSAIIVISSATMFFSVRAAKRDEIGQLKAYLSATVFLGLAFLIGQVMSWSELIANNVYFTGGNPSESFLYVLTGIHWLHIVSSLIFGGIVLANAFMYKVHSKSMVKIEMLSAYWHFLGALWIYLFVFLMLYHQ